MRPRCECTTRAILAALVLAVASVSCESSPAADPRQEPRSVPAPTAASAEGAREVRSTGTVRAVREFGIEVPRIHERSGRMTLVRLISNGAKVEKDAVLAEFDRTEQVDSAREASAKYEDLCHQVDQRKAENRSNREKRAEEREQALADLAKARIQIRLGPVLAEIERLKNEVKLEDAKIHVASLEKSQALREAADAAALRIVELKAERQRVALERAQGNAEKLVVKAPLAGMVAHENTWRSGSMGPPQVGDQMWAGQALVRLFDPSEMEIHTQVGEPDGAVLVSGARALVRLDAYPELTFQARLTAASPVAAAPLESPIRTFNARFRLEGTDPHLLPDLSAAVIILPPEKAEAARATP